MSDLQLITDIHCVLNEDSSAVSFSDFSSLKRVSFTKEDALDFAMSPSKISKKYSDDAVLGVFEGVFFMPNGYSRNRRFYPESLWSKCIESNEVRQKLSGGQMLGMLEHPTTMNTEENGHHTSAHPMYSGIVTKNLKIVEKAGIKYGIGKAYILNTPVGNVLNVMMKARDENGNPLITMAVSSRAFASVSGKDSRGNDIMEANSYKLISFDVVMNPGIPEAVPSYRSAAESILLKTCECIGHCEDNLKQKLRDELKLKYL